MPDRRRHRGPHPDDRRLFAPPYEQALRDAVADLSWLLSRGYADPSALQIVGNRYQLTERQRKAVMRSACSEAARVCRQAKAVAPDTINSLTIQIDGYNLLTSIEAALSGGLLLIGRDGALRDLASVHGSFRKVQETEPALMMIGQCLTTLGASQVTWLLDRPVSNSGRLAKLMRELAGAQHWPWEVELVDDPDSALSSASDVIVTADSVVLDGCERWLNLARLIVRERVPDAWVLDFADVGLP